MQAVSENTKVDEIVRAGRGILLYFMLSQLSIDDVMPLCVTISQAV